MLSRWQGGFAAGVITLLAVVLVILDATDAGMRRWWSGHALTTDTYMIMLPVGAPIMIDERISRNFLEQAQRLGGEMARVLAVTGTMPGPAASSPGRLEHAVRQLREASTPLIAALDSQTQAAVRGGESA